MLSIGFVVTPGFPVMSLAALSVFEFANVSTSEKRYDIHILSEHGGAVATAMGTRLDTTAFGDTHFDTLIIGGNTEVIATSPALLAYVTAAATSSRRISSICTGAFALADAGLLQNRRVTTHWLFTEQLKANYPGLKLEADRLYIVDGPVWTAAGNGAGIDLTLGMLEQDLGAELARQVAKIMVIDQQRAGGQSQHSALLDINAKSDRIQEALSFARNNLQAELSVEQLAQVARLSPRQFSRAFRLETATTPAKAIERLRVEAAQLLIAQSRHSIDVIATDTGFGDQERMRRAFLRVLGHPPQTLRRMAQGS